jgi:hypothetical protein
MKTNIKKSLTFSLPAVVFLAAFITWLAGFQEGFAPGLLIGLFVGGVIALVVGLLFSDTEKEGLVELRGNKEKRSIAKGNFKKLLPNLLILFVGAALTRYSGRIYLFFAVSIALCIAVTFIQSIKSGEYKKAKAEGELTAYYALLFTLPVSLLSQFVMFLLIVFGGNVKAIVKLLQ